MRYMALWIAYACVASVSARAHGPYVAPSKEVTTYVSPPEYSVKEETPLFSETYELKTRERIDALRSRLGDEDYDVRESAQRELEAEIESQPGASRQPGQISAGARYVRTLLDQDLHPDERKRLQDAWNGHRARRDEEWGNDYTSRRESEHRRRNHTGQE